MSSTERYKRSAGSIRFRAGILRDCTPGPSVREEGMIQSDPHGDMGSSAEMTEPLSVRAVHAPTMESSNKNA